MTVRERDRKRLQLALRIISGRWSPENLDTGDYETLGFDTYKFGYYGKPDGSDVLAKCEAIVFDSIVPPEPQS